MQNRKLLNSYFHLKTVKTSLAVCNITGISIETNLPFIPEKIYEYVNPLAFPSNAKSLGEMNYSNGLDRISPQVLAGCILSLLTEYSLIQDKLSSIERNILLCEIPQFHLSQALQFLAKLKQKQIEKLPYISLDGTETKESSIFIVFTEYIKECKRILYVPENTVRTSLISLTGSKKKEFKHTNFSSEIRQQAKDLVTALIVDEIIPAKLASVLKIAYRKENLVTMPSELRSKIISILKTFSASNEAQELAQLLKDIENNKTVSERILQKQLDSGQELEMEYHADTNIPSVKLSLSEILDRKIHPEKYITELQEQYENTENEIETIEENIEDETDSVSNFINELQEINSEIEQDTLIEQEFKQVVNEGGDNDEF